MVGGTLKVCRLCKQEKELSEYYKSKARTRDNLRHECKSCINKSTTDYYNRNKSKLVKVRKEYHYKRLYNITLDQRNQMILEQDGCCYICQIKGKLVVDHCHATGKVRKMLCDRCNWTLGHINDDVSILPKLKLYIEEHKQE